jgi:hypothetical protein
MDKCSICGGRTPGVTCFHTWGDIQQDLQRKRQKQLRKEVEDKKQNKTP